MSIIINTFASHSNRETFQLDFFTINIIIHYLTISVACNDDGQYMSCFFIVLNVLDTYLDLNLCIAASNASPSAFDILIGASGYTSCRP